MPGWPELEFKVTIVEMLVGLEKRVEDIRKSLNAEIKELKSKQVEIKNTITGMHKKWRL